MNKKNGCLEANSVPIHCTDLLSLRKKKSIDDIHINLNCYASFGRLNRRKRKKLIVMTTCIAESSNTALYLRIILLFE